MKLTNSPKLNKALYEMGIHDYKGVVFHIPRKYDVFKPGEESVLLEDKAKVVITGKLVNTPMEVPSFKVRKIVFSVLTPTNDNYEFIAYNQPYLLNYFNLEQTYTFYGTYSQKSEQITLSKVSKSATLKGEVEYRPIYTLANGIKTYEYQNLVKKAFEEVKGTIKTEIPSSLLEKYEMPTKEEALYNLHFPKTERQIRRGLLHLKYEEALSFSLKNILISNENNSLVKLKSNFINVNQVNRFIESLPYTLTEDQQTAVNEIIEDMNSDKLMYRLLQGDVGSGKTIVAFIALYANFLRGNQGALMAPTETLAKQHYDNMKEIFSGTKIKIGLLHGGLSKEERNIILDDLTDGTLDIVIGTHALFSKGTKFSNLGLVVIDEQHRFGVNQRTALMDKGKDVDLLMMSATPIPRSLAQTIFSDLSLSTLYSFPTKKRQVETSLVYDEEDVFNKIEQLIKENKKVYVVAPVIDSDIEEDNNMKLFDKYQERYPSLVTQLNGRMNSEQKEEAVSLFRNGDKPILVSTQVVELGIDVGDAALMVIYGARRLGLSSLHQLRGRVGRKGDNASCFLVINDSYSQEEIERLVQLTKIDDGFKLSELDLESRGPGEMLGLRQTGLPDFNYLNIKHDLSIFKAAQKDAKLILKNRETNREYSLYVLTKQKEIEASDNQKA
ncbi:MAG: ATP-dependent DNA helicase RecG [Coprobacillus sp.]|nr:ATP-dependent DNA helicase RecG [Coprobacillus sp.]